MARRKRRGASPLREPRPGVFDNRTRLVALAMVAFALLLVVWARRRDAQAPAAPPGTTSDGDGVARSTPPSPAGPFGMTASQPPSQPAPSAGGADPAPVIDDVVLEKKEVCSGEENLVTVKAHTVNGTDPFLHTVIDGKQGSSIPVSLWKDDDGNVLGAHTITVFGRNNVATTVPLPAYEVMDCRPTYIAEIRQRVRSNTWADFDFLARVVGVPRAPTAEDRKRGAPPPLVPRPFKPVAFTWTFGDGDGATTLTPVVEHDYESRPQVSLYSYFVVGVSIRGAKGETATGRMTLPLINPAFESISQKGIVTLMIALDPRFPAMGSDGRVTQSVRLWHAQPGPVTIERAILTKYYRQAAGQTPPQDVDVGSVLGTATIPPGRDGITATVTLDPALEEEVFSKTWALSGHSAEGYPVVGSFSVMLPPPKPGPDAGTTVFDPLLKEKILAAREILGQDVVDDEDLWRLEREGMFANLKVTPQQAAVAASAAVADAIRRGPPSQQGPVTRGPAAPQSTAEQAAAPANAGPAPAASK